MPSNAGDIGLKVKATVGYQKITVAMTEEMFKRLDEERKLRMIATVPEVVRSIIGEYFKTKEPVVK